MIRMMVQLNEEQLAALKKLARARKTSVTRLVLERVAGYVATAAKDAARERKRQRALEFLDYAGKNPEEFHDIEGKPDLANDHDKYFVGAIEDALRRYYCFPGNAFHWRP